MGSALYGISYSENGLFSVELNQQDTLTDNQILYNGRIWRNLYYNVGGDQFLFSKEFLPASLIIRGKKFNNISILYDIYKDEILTPVLQGDILQINKEMVDSFSIRFQNKTYQFARIPKDISLGYVNVIYKGKTALYIKFNKKIEKLAVEGKYDKFYQESQTLFIKDTIIHQIKDKSDLIKVLKEAKEPIRNFMKKNKIKITKNNPESIIPVIQYYDTLKD